MAESALLADPAGTCRGGLRWERDELLNVDCIRGDLWERLPLNSTGDRAVFR
jgi:hypothetical protein